MNIEHLIIFISPSIISKKILIIRFPCTISGTVLIYCACIVSLHYRYKIKHRVAQNCGSIAVQMYCTVYYCLQSDQRPCRREMEGSRRARGPPPQYSVSHSVPIGPAAEKCSARLPLACASRIYSCLL